MTTRGRYALPLETKVCAFPHSGPRTNIADLRFCGQHKEKEHDQT